MKIGSVIIYFNKIFFCVHHTNNNYYLLHFSKQVYDFSIKKQLAVMKQIEIDHAILTEKLERLQHVSTFNIEIVDRLFTKQRQLTQSLKETGPSSLIKQ